MTIETRESFFCITGTPCELQKNLRDATTGDTGSVQCRSLDEYVGKHPNSHRKSDWYGGYSANDAMSRHDWPEGRAYFSDIRPTIESIAAPMARRRKRMRSEHDGELSLDRALAGETDCFDDMRPATVPSSGRIIRVSIEFGDHSGIEGKDLAWGGCAAAIFVDAAEDAGYRCEIDGLMPTRNTYPHQPFNRNALIRVPVKQAEQPLDIDRLLFVVAWPAFFRGCVIATLAKAGAQCGQGYGRPGPAPDWAHGDVHFGRAANRSDALRSLQIALDTLKELAK